MAPTPVPDLDEVRRRAAAVVEAHPPTLAPLREVMAAWYDAGLAWVHFPVGLGGLGASRTLQAAANDVLKAHGGPEPRTVNTIGYGIVAATIVAHASTEQAHGWLRPLATGEEIWCQLFSEPGAGSDLAGLATRAVRDGDGWVVDGQKVWTSLAHQARWAVLLARTDPDVPKHAGITYFVVDMHAPGVEVRPLRQMTGQSQFNEVFLTGVRIPDRRRLGEIGDGWRVARSTLSDERQSLGDRATARDVGPIGEALALWAEHPDRHTPVLRHRLTALWTRAEAHRLTCLRAKMAGSSGPESSIAKVVASELNQQVYEFCNQLLGAAGTLYPSYEVFDDPGGAIPVQRSFLRSRASTIEGGTSEIQRNIIAERALGMPAERAVDRDRPWREVPRS